MSKPTFETDESTEFVECDGPDEVFTLRNLRYMIDRACERTSDDLPVTFVPVYDPDESSVCMAWDDPDKPTRLFIRVVSPTFTPEEVFEGHMLTLPGPPPEVVDALRSLLGVVLMGRHIPEKEKH